MEYYLGIDLGTSYFKAGLFDQHGRLKALGRQFVKKESDNGLTCELSVSGFRDTLKACVGEALLLADANISEVKAVSYASQANSFILLDQENDPVTPFILWPDKRAGETGFPSGFFNRIPEFQTISGLGIRPGPEFAAAKIRWFIREHPGIWQKVRRAMTISDYLIFSLTGQYCSDFSSASLTGLFDITRCQWSDAILQLFQLNPDYLSFPLRTGTLIGDTTKEGGEFLGLGRGIPVVAGGLDHHIAAIGTGIPFSGNISESTGTVLACVTCREGTFPHENLCVAPGLDENHYFQMAFDENGATPLEWYQKNHASGHTIPELLEMAANVRPGCEGLVAFPRADLSPGLTGFGNVKEIHRHGHFVRAILESTAMSLNLLLSGIPDSSGKGIVSTGGGAQSRLWTEIKAIITGRVFYLPEYSETACLGAAMLAASVTGNSGNLKEISGKWAAFKETICPVSGNQESA